MRLSSDRNDKILLGVLFAGVLYGLSVAVFYHLDSLVKLPELAPIVAFIYAELLLLGRGLLIGRVVRPVLPVLLLALTAVIGVKNKVALTKLVTLLWVTLKKVFLSVQELWRTGGFLLRSLCAIGSVCMLIATGWLLLFFALMLPVVTVFFSRRMLLLGFNTLFEHYVKPLYRALHRRTLLPNPRAIPVVKTIRRYEARTVRNLRKLHTAVRYRLTERTPRRA